MAYTDFDFTQFRDTDYSGGSWGGSGEGVATSNSTITPNPLSGDGTFARELTASPASGQQFRSNALVMIKQAAAGGVFGTVPNTKALSLRCMVRLSVTDVNFGASDRGFGTGLFVKGVPHASGANTGFYGDQWAGYRLRLTNVPTPGSLATTVQLRLSALDTAGAFGSLGAGGNVLCSGSYAVNNWYNLRLDVTPQGNGSDLLEAYTAPYTDVDGAEVWTLVGSLNVPSSSTQFIPWGSATHRHGFYAMSDYVTTIGGVFYRTYFDRFAATIASV